MRILSVLTYYDPHWTGLTAYAQRLAEGLTRRGHEVTVLTSRHSSELPASERLNGVRVVRLPVLGRLSRGVVMPSFPRVARRLIREHDVVQFHTPLLEAWLVTALARRAGTPALMTHHGDLVMPDGLGNRVVERAVTWLMRQGERGATRISIYTRDYAAHSAFLRPFAGKLAYILPPVEIPRPDPAATAAWKRELGLGGARVIGFAGRFVEEKGFDFLLRAFPLVKARLPSAKLLFAGETNVVYERFWARCGPLVERHRADLVTLGLLRDRERLARFHAMCDVLALPSRTDAFAAVQVEAMLCGTPVVAADIPGAREVVRLTGMGRLVRPRDPEALAEGLLEVLGDRQVFVKDHAAVRAVFDPEQSVSEYEALLRDMTAGARA